MSRFIAFAAASILLGSTAAFASPRQTPTQPPAPPSNAPQDKPTTVNGDEAVAKLNRAVAPYIAKAQKTYPEAKARFLKGLPAGQRFFVTYSLREKESKRSEQVFIAVQTIKMWKITGAIANNLDFVKTYKRGQVITFPETEILDWTISRPDGTEEGNFVGKFMDTYKP